jgi:hypothetical protein
MATPDEPAFVPVLGASLPATSRAPIRGGLTQLLDYAAPDPAVMFDDRREPLLGGRKAHYLIATTNFDDAESAKGRPIFRTLVSFDGGESYAPMKLENRKTKQVKEASVFESLDAHPWASKSVSWWAPEMWPVEVPIARAPLDPKPRTERRYMVLYTARKEDGELAIGAAFAKKPWETFKDLGKPLIVNTDGDQRGVIDATYVPFLDAISWKKDGNHAVMVNGKLEKVPTPIYLQKAELTDGGVKLTGEKKVVITNDRAWEDDLVEGPVFWKRGDRTFCFYSGNCYADDRYATGVAWTDGDPFAAECVWKKWDGPFLSSETPLIKEAGFAGPGHCMIYPVEGSDEIEMVFHAWPKWALVEPRVHGEQRTPLKIRIGFDDRNLPYVVPGTLHPRSPAP